MRLGAHAQNRKKPAPLALQMLLQEELMHVVDWHSLAKVQRGDDVYEVVEYELQQ
jgi:hypothetical protein